MLFHGCNQNMWGTEPLGRDLSSQIAVLVFQLFVKYITSVCSNWIVIIFIVIFSGWEAWGENNNGTCEHTTVYTHMHDHSQTLLYLDLAVTLPIFPVFAYILLPVTKYRQQSVNIGNSHFIQQIQGEIVDIPEAQQPPNPTAKCPIYRWNLQHKYNYTVSSLADKYWQQKVYHCCLTLSFVFPSMASRMCCCWVSSLGQMEGCCRRESQVSVQKNIGK